MSQVTFLTHKGSRWFWVHLIFLIICLALYCLYDPVGGRHGGTWLGYTYGGLSFAAIIYLMWYGIRKRSYKSAQSTVKGWLAVHVWLGLTLVVLVLLHSGFQLGWNVHTLAYGLMCLTVVSGVWGALNYLNLAPYLKSHRGGGTIVELVRQRLLISKELEALCDGRSDAFLRLAKRLDRDFKVSPLRSLIGGAPEPVDKKVAAELLLNLPADERDQALQLIRAIDQKYEVNLQLRDEVAVQTKLKVWLWLHVPLAFGCVIAVLIHIFAVFMY